MERSAIRDRRSAWMESRITRSLSSGGASRRPVGSIRASKSRATIPCVARRAKHPSHRSIRAGKKIPLYRNSESAYVSWQPGPRTRGVSRSSRTRAGRRWTPMTSARRVFAGRATVSEAIAHTTGVIGVRQNRVVLAPAVWRQVLWRCAVRPGHTSVTRKATGQ